MKTYQVLATFCAVLSVASAADVKTETTAVALPTQTRRLDEDAWDNGTKVYKEFPNEGWWSGTITSYSKATGMYTVTWEDGSTDYYDDNAEIDQMVAFAQNDPQNNPAGAEDVSGAYPAGTRVSVFEDGEWYDGVIIKYGSGTYTIQWDEEDEIEEIPAGTYFDQMVADGFGDDDTTPEGYVDDDAAAEDDDADWEPTVTVGADVSYYDEEDDEWYDGQITDYRGGVYTVVWSDGSTDEYDDSGEDLELLKQAISDTYGDDDSVPIKNPTDGPKYKVGTEVYDFEDGYWMEGEIVTFENGAYVVEWEDEDEYEYYESHDAEDMQLLKQMVHNSKGDDDAPPEWYFEDEDLWKIGTPVAVREDDILWYGKIDGFSDGEYSIAWDNGEQEWLDNYDLVNTMVANAVENPKGMSGAGKFFLSLFVLSVAAVGSVYGFKYYQKVQTEKRFDRNMEDEDGFRDQPDNLPKII